MQGKIKERFAVGALGVEARRKPLPFVGFEPASFGGPVGEVEPARRRSTAGQARPR